MTANLKLNSIDVGVKTPPTSNNASRETGQFCQVTWVCDGNLYSQLLVDLIQRETGFTCKVQKTCMFQSDKVSEHSLYLLDHTQFSEAHLTQILASISSVQQCQVALWNLEQDDDCACYLPWSVLKGVFYKDSSEALLIKGIRTLAAGGHWFTRHQLDLIAAQRVSPECHHGVELSLREKEILRGLAEGKSNQVIADDLSRSLHTIKTHLYNLYRKLGVSNRNQAVHWASRNRLL